MTRDACKCQKIEEFGCDAKSEKCHVTGGKNISYFLRPGEKRKRKVSVAKPDQYFDLCSAVKSLIYSEISCSILRGKYLSVTKTTVSRSEKYLQLCTQSEKKKFGHRG